MQQTLPAPNSTTLAAIPSPQPLHLDKTAVPPISTARCPGACDAASPSRLWRFADASSPCKSRPSPAHPPTWSPSISLVLPSPCRPQLMLPTPGFPLRGVEGRVVCVPPSTPPPPQNKFLDLPAAAGGGPAAQIQKVWFACRGCTQPQPTHVGRQPCRKLKPRPVRTLAGDCDKLGWVLTQHSTRPQLLHLSRGLAWIRRANLSNGTSIKMRWKIWDEQNLLALTENRKRRK